MKRTQLQWFIEHRPARGHAWLNAGSGAYTKRECLQAELNRCLEPWPEKHRGEAYDRFQKRKRDGLVRAVRVQMTWEASK